jgi:DNA polymerase/3'-5' exonuclease PolX
MPKHKNIPRIPLSEAKKIFNSIKNKLPFPAYVSGSIRRHQQYVNDIDIIIIPRSLNDLDNYILPLFDKVIRSGEHIINGIMYHKNKPVLIDFFVTTKKELPYSQLQYTGDKNYILHIRRYTRDQLGWTLNQYGLFYVNDPTKRVRGSTNLKTEKDVIKFIGTNWYEPWERVT